jgi:hypothetical protein
LIFKKNANFLTRKLEKLAENCHHNIDPWSGCRAVATAEIRAPLFPLEFPHDRESRFIATAEKSLTDNSRFQRQDTSTGRFVLREAQP